MCEEARVEKWNDRPISGSQVRPNFLSSSLKDV